MTPNEERLMREMMIEALRDELRPIAKRIEALEQRDKELAADDRKLSGQHKLVLNQALPKLATDLSIERTEDLKAISLAFTRVSHVVSDLGDRLARMEARSNLGLMTVRDALGGESIKPASVVAANNTAAIAVDTTATSDNIRIVRRWQKIFLPMAAAAPVVTELVKAVWPHL